jgi:hypothetical protein
MSLHQSFLDCAAFVGTLEPDRSITYRGTGFFVAIKSPRAERTAYVYFVTAKHNVVEAGDQPLAIRCNTPGGAESVIASTEGLDWYFHHDPTVDVAVLDVPADLGLNPTVVYTDQFVYHEGLRSGDSGWGIGDDIYIIGLFNVTHGKERNTPIVRKGALSQVPDEEFKTAIGPSEVYLIEASAIRGLSGSPVFIQAPLLQGNAIVRRGVTGYYRLLGLLHGHWTLPRDAIQFSESSDGPNAIEDSYNSRIGIVTPARFILEVIDQPGPRSSREAVFSQETPPQEEA